jgi:hypothetical protein
VQRIAILDHASHTLFVEDIHSDVLSMVYRGNIEAYIKNNYTFEGDFSWEYITDAQYLPEYETDPIEINFEDIADI